MRLEPKLKFLNGQTKKTLIDAPKHDMLQTERMLTSRCPTCCRICSERLTDGGSGSPPTVKSHEGVSAQSSGGKLIDQNLGVG
jgi:hypothetical protein